MRYSGKAVRPRFKEADLQPNGDGNPEPRSRRENGGLEHEKASSGGVWKEACPMWKEADLQPNGLEARTRVWNMRKLKPIRGEKVESGELKV